MEERHAGGCHCGAVRYEVAVDLSQPALECNCSHCQIKGLLLMFAPREALAVTSGQDALTEYRFNTEKIQHLFCPTCGVEPFGFGAMADGTPTCAVNVRTIDGIDLAVLARTPVDGRSF